MNSSDCVINIRPGVGNPIMVICDPQNKRHEGDKKITRSSTPKDIASVDMSVTVYGVDLFNLPKRVHGD